MKQKGQRTPVLLTYILAIFTFLDLHLFFWEHGLRFLNSLSGVRERCAVQEQIRSLNHSGFDCIDFCRIATFKNKVKVIRLQPCQGCDSILARVLGQARVYCPGRRLDVIAVAGPGATADAPGVWSWKRRQIRHHRMPLDPSLQEHDRQAHPPKMVRRDSNMPAKQARRKVAALHLFAAVADLIGYERTLNKSAHPARPMIFLIVVGYTTTTVSQVLDALMVDLPPQDSATASVANNLVRCSLGAAFTMAI
ncbi:hypothetical protein PG990_013444 [Apiospora arundinis]